MQTSPDNNLGLLKKRPLSLFIRKLWHILSEKEYEEFIHWVDNGQVVCIPNSTLFSQRILPKFFKHNNWQSFVRQLNLYGFRKVYQLNLGFQDYMLEKRTVWHFKHDAFQMDKPDILCEIKRQSNRHDVDSKHENQSKQEESIETCTLTQNDVLKNEIYRVKQKIQDMDNNSTELSQQILNLSKLQRFQQKTINTLIKTLLEVTESYPGIRVDDKKVSDIAHELNLKNTNNMVCVERFLAQKVNEEKEVDWENIEDYEDDNDDEKEYDMMGEHSKEMQMDSPDPSSPPSNTLPQNSTNKTAKISTSSMPSISSLINETVIDDSPPVKRCKITQ